MRIFFATGTSGSSVALRFLEALAGAVSVVDVAAVSCVASLAACVEKLAVAASSPVVARRQHMSIKQKGAMHLEWFEGVDSLFFLVAAFFTVFTVFFVGAGASASFFGGLPRLTGRLVSPLVATFFA